MKKIIRSRFFIWAFKWIHPTISYRIARRISRSGHDKEINEKRKEDIRSEIKQKAEKQDPESKKQKNRKAESKKQRKAKKSKKTEMRNRKSKENQTKATIA